MAENILIEEPEAVPAPDAAPFAADAADDQALISDSDDGEEELIITRADLESTGFVPVSDAAGAVEAEISSALSDLGLSTAEQEYSQRLSAKSADLLRSLQQDGGAAGGSGHSSWMDDLAKNLGGDAQPAEAAAAPAPADLNVPELDVADGGPVIQDAVLQGSEAAEAAAEQAQAAEDELRRTILNEAEQAPSAPKKNRFFSFFRS